MTSDPYPPSDETASLVLLRLFKRKIKEGRGRVSDPFFRQVPNPQTHSSRALPWLCRCERMQKKKKNFNHQKSPITAQQPATNLSPRDAFQKWQRHFGEASTRSSPWHTPPSWTHPDSRRIYSGCLLITRRLLSFPTGLKEPDAQILIRDWSAILIVIIWRRVTVLSAAARHGGRMEFVLINMGLVRGGCAVGN